MPLSPGKRSVTALFSDPLCPFCHRTRIVVAEKNISAEIIDIDPANLPEDLVRLNPHNSAPTLVARDLILYDSKVIMEYFDERFPHPPLMPVDPISRARIRLMFYRIDQDWYRLLGGTKTHRSNISSKTRKMLIEDLTILSPTFEKTPFFMNEEFSLLDCALAPLLWRLLALEAELPPQAKLVEDYANRMFARDSFQQSLSAAERAMRTKATSPI
ncbi:Glutathione S-transferase-like protein [Nitrosococcus oceani ATCC 19707]|uniref:Glutathione S-transferase-like protein n=2 Tax=Nitrosococcus oceani TaxID=1229 RepID=Q3JEC1_NITOC|nr:glutathione S-transferase N-terminal domain-containing protein [Nitrosococcus oceani]ABA56825.1 Glutathione S-transferase-like protein [Nitrosococcus oceani ATCC 19707]KFI20778.1 stringent starvation protein A [Nitrosococcus oceani C-27]GEM20582.1 stringent starvation protein A [Nitrosococcus oceani]